MAPAKPTAFNVDLCQPLADAAPVVAATLHDGLPRSGYLTAGWVKRHYSISNSTLYKWIAEKRFVAPVKIGPRAVRWRAEDLRAFEASLMENGH